MAWDLACIGFGSDPDMLRAQLERVAGEADERLVTETGEYAIWRSRCGAEVWFHLAQPTDDGGEREIVGLTPFFEGRSELPFRVRDFSRSSSSDFEGVCTGSVSGEARTEHMITFEVVDAAAWQELAVRSGSATRLAGFARDISVVELGAFDLSLLEKDTDALFKLTGRVAFVSTLLNEATGTRFFALEISLGEGTIDLVAASETARPVREGDVIEANCKLLGRILD